MTMEANVWNKNNREWREIVDSSTITVNVGTDEKVSFDLVPGSTGSTGSSSLDFGSHPGKFSTSLAVTGQTDIAADTLVHVWIAPAATADHTADEHLRNPPRVYAGNVIAGTGFTIYARAGDTHRRYGVWNVGWAY